MRKIGVKAPKGASLFPEILSYIPGEPRNSASLTPPWNGGVSGLKGVVEGVGLEPTACFAYRSVFSECFQPFRL